MSKQERSVFGKGQRGITGLETAIILIAFVVVASVFAYTVLSAGIFGSEKGKEAVYSGLETARASMALTGPVVARDTDADGDIDQVIYTVVNALKGEAINLAVTTDADSDGIVSDETTRINTTVVTYRDLTTRTDDLAWTRTQVGKGDGDHLLEPGEKFTITVTIPTSITLDAYDKFTLEMKPDTGAALIFERTLGSKVDTFNSLN